MTQLIGTQSSMIKSAPALSSRMLGAKVIIATRLIGNSSSPTLRSVAVSATASPQPPTSFVFNPAGYVKYAAAIPSQVTFMTVALWGLQQLNEAVIMGGSIPLPAGLPPQDACKGIVILFFLVVSIKSRIFSPLDASRPNVKGEKEAISQRKRPSWMPPPLTFPLVWTTIGLLRATSSVMVWEACGRDLLSLPLITMMLHLAIGDAWNHCNNVEQNLGMAVPGVVLGCLGSGIFVTASYFMVDKTAGMVLSPMCLWLTIASALVYSIWCINPREDGQKQPLFPVREANSLL
ncbi:hypothetical protein CEUSTIGMA_g9137.t1 [Chlamydomonas eustigma]|uniref:TspO/MBR-related protein n=1 Tax=Chlamydomonas eustigma TaxID=1157962 RepID=A0A250XFL8_9CHLO|nr:hypothetical protein CEUSTIGMA_g9137.t1 [Chlamydomonas eustigma]|eukprot:GAX81709.1 hypothetical protein CEUSTIGMA_g9137.t1 [Chlamydomonas eustigma]